ncbi:hypothetical protein BRADI_2g42665v3 [Brachypodium distachyon]|uniref:Uncharacterized protein n=1 Tax=Brachypodium distachyon TaxID=15368 RepID=A0A0Q3MW91_BRADI|nr:hypothetical protein BRADI_2g42665v3 [Brachypodium distachyon]
MLLPRPLTTALAASHGGADRLGIDSGGSSSGILVCGGNCGEDEAVERTMRKKIRLFWWIPSEVTSRPPTIF